MTMSSEIMVKRKPEPRQKQMETEDETVYLCTSCATSFTTAPELVDHMALCDGGVASAESSPRRDSSDTYTRTEMSCSGGASPSSGGAYEVTSSSSDEETELQRRSVDVMSTYSSDGPQQLPHSDSREASASPSLFEPLPHQLSRPWAPQERQLTQIQLDSVHRNFRDFLQEQNTKTAAVRQRSPQLSRKQPDLHLVPQGDESQAPKSPTNGLRYAGESYEELLTCLECTTCNLKLPSSSAMNAHAKVCPELVSPCPVCRKTFTRVDALHRHLKIHSQHRKFNCDVCTKRFHRKDHLQTHYRIHTGDTPYQCVVCEKRFRYYIQWKNHKSAHTEEEFAAKGHSAAEGEGELVPSGTPKYRYLPMDLKFPNSASPPSFMNQFLHTLLTPSLGELSQDV